MFIYFFNRDSETREKLINEISKKELGISTLDKYLPTGLSSSFSHSGNISSLAYFNKNKYTNVRSIGIDLERRDRPENLPSRHILNKSDETENLTLVEILSIKESVFKAVSKFIKNDYHYKDLYVKLIQNSVIFTGGFLQVENPLRVIGFYVSTDLYIFSVSFVIGRSI